MRKRRSRQGGRCITPLGRVFGCGGLQHSECAQATIPGRIGGRQLRFIPLKDFTVRKMDPDGQFSGTPHPLGRYDCGLRFAISVAVIMVPTKVLKTINYFPQRCPQRSGVASDADHLPQPQASDQYMTFGLVLGNGADLEIFNWVAPSIFTILTEGLP